MIEAYYAEALRQTYCRIRFLLNEEIIKLKRACLTQISIFRKLVITITAASLLHVETQNTYSGRTGSSI